MQILASILAAAGICSAVHAGNVCSCPENADSDNLRAEKIVRAMSNAKSIDQATMDAILNASSIEDLTLEQKEMVLKLVQAAAGTFRMSMKPIV